MTKTATRATEAELLAKHSHLVPETLAYISPTGGCDNPNVPADMLITHANKQVCQIRTRGIDGQPDGKTRWIATSDLHQVYHTQATKDAMDKAKRNQKAKTNRALLKQITATVA